jgi:hypothetical protein
MKVRWILRAVFSLILVITNISHVSAVSIDVLNTQHTTFVSTWFRGEIQDSYSERTSVSSDPVSDYMYAEKFAYYGPEYYLGVSEASANANLFDISVYTWANEAENAASASAKSEVTFSPVMNSSDTISLDFSLRGEYLYTAGFVSLFDVTSNQEIWNYGWEFPGIIIGLPDLQPAIALEIDTSFLAAHVYKLEMFTQSWANGDVQWVDIALSGLEPTRVPEPSTLLLLGIGLAGIAGYGRRRMRREKGR